MGLILARMPLCYLSVTSEVLLLQPCSKSQLLSADGSHSRDDILICVQRCCQCLSNWSRVEADQVWAATYAVQRLCSVEPRSDGCLLDSSPQCLGVLHIPSSDLCALMQRCGTPRRTLPPLPHVCVAPAGAQSNCVTRSFGGLPQFCW